MSDVDVKALNILTELTARGVTEVGGRPDFGHMLPRTNASGVLDISLLPASIRGETASGSLEFVRYCTPGALGGDGTAAHPYGTLAEAFSGIQPGTVVALGPGIYEGSSISLPAGSNVSIVGLGNASQIGNLSVVSPDASSTITLSGLSVSTITRSGAKSTIRLYDTTVNNVAGGSSSTDIELHGLSSKVGAYTNCTVSYVGTKEAQAAFSVVQPGGDPLTVHDGRAYIGSAQVALTSDIPDGMPTQEELDAIRNSISSVESALETKTTAISALVSAEEASRVSGDAQVKSELSAALSTLEGRIETAETNIERAVSEHDSLAKKEHTHATADIQGLDSALESKASAKALSDLQTVVSQLQSSTSAPVDDAISAHNVSDSAHQDIRDLIKSITPAVGELTIADINGLQSALDDKIGQSTLADINTSIAAKANDDDLNALEQRVDELDFASSSDVQSAIETAIQAHNNDQEVHGSITAVTELAADIDEVTATLTEHLTDTAAHPEILSGVNSAITSAVAAHNSSDDAHNDIRTAIELRPTTEAVGTMISTALESIDTGSAPVYGGGAGPAYKEREVGHEIVLVPGITKYVISKTTMAADNDGTRSIKWVSRSPVQIDTQHWELEIQHGEAVIIEKPDGFDGVGGYVQVKLGGTYDESTPRVSLFRVWDQFFSHSIQCEGMGSYGENIYGDQIYSPEPIITYVLQDQYVIDEETQEREFDNYRQATKDDIARVLDAQEEGYGVDGPIVNAVSIRYPTTTPTLDEMCEFELRIKGSVGSADWGNVTWIDVAGRRVDPPITTPYTDTIAQFRTYNRGSSWLARVQFAVPAAPVTVFTGKPPDGFPSFDKLKPCTMIGEASAHYDIRDGSFTLIRDGDIEYGQITVSAADGSVLYFLNLSNNVQLMVAKSTWFEVPVGFSRVDVSYDKSQSAVTAPAFGLASVSINGRDIVCPSGISVCDFIASPYNKYIEIPTSAEPVCGHLSVDMASGYVVIAGDGVQHPVYCGDGTHLGPYEPMEGSLTVLAG